MNMLLALAGTLLLAVSATALDNGLGRVPQMGWNSWYDTGCSLDETIIKATVDAMQSTGLAKLGYKYINLDDCWAKGRYANGTVYADPKYFPSGTLKVVADYAHERGFLFGTYTDRGTKTCGGRPGALGYEKIDAQTYADWGIDYLKEDSCYASSDHETAFQEYGAMRDALNATGRPIFFSLCGWNPWYAPVGQSLGNSWRIGPDDTNWNGVLKNTDINAQLASYAGPGGWNDPCLLLAEENSGALRMTQLQTRAQFNLWAIMASPLLISANVRNMSAANLATYSNAEVIAVNQDPRGLQGIRLAGGDLAGGGSGGNTPASVTQCNSSDPSQIWQYNHPASEYVYNAASGKCLNVNDCGTSVIYFSCVTSGGTCCGPTCYDNMKFQVQGTTLTSPNKPGMCAETDSSGQVNFVACNATSDGQYWAMTAGGQLSNGRDGKMCLSTTISSGKTNVWGRRLAPNGNKSSWALLFINVDGNANDVTCDSACFARLGVSGSVQARNLWTKEEFTIDASTGYTAKAVEAEGGSVMLRLTSA